MPKRMGFEGRLLYGTAGTTAATLLTIARDVNYTIETVEADVSDRGSFTNVYDAAGGEVGLEFEINNQSTDAFVALVRAAAFGGGAMAFLTEDATSGEGIDADFIVSIDESQPLRDRQAIKVTCKPTDKSGRAPAWA